MAFLVIQLPDHIFLHNEWIEDNLLRDLLVGTFPC